ncbi:D-alanyl-D-alanine carboxypeptidase family protein [Ruminococcus sp.]|uniref:D-alanyl-D-alanine carboxypeptidase family protein n=1 Tax=Ruminococcus sp. TaxID=41978 RepID=UPI0025D6284F|nr:D-alanyl-D-alanine carboxypeptidase family protein [Ruminococcus sp.]MBQ6251173.1 D-alanyl-D-alanine carboxypeptidase family protein [Ruminococcus sp.]
MRAKRLIASVLSFTLCAGVTPAVSANAVGSEAAAVTMGVNNSNITDAKTNAGSTALIPAASLTSDTADNPTIVTIRLGDVNGDSMIDANDASAILAAYANISGSSKTSDLTAVQTIAADVNMDGKTDAVDASNVLSYYAYLSTKGNLSIEDFLKVNSSETTVTTTAPPVTTAAKVTFTTTTVKPPVTTTSAAPAATTTSAVPVTATSAAATSAANTTTTAAVPTATTSAAPTTTTTASETTTTSTTTTTTTSATTTTTFTTTTTTYTTTTATTTVTTTTTVYVDPYKVSEIKLSKTEIELNVGTGGISYVTMLPATADKREIWSCSDESVAVVDNEGWIVGKSEGVCTVTVTSFNNPAVKADIKVTVKDPNKVSSIRLTKTDMRLPIGGGDISYVTMLPANAYNKAEIWVSSDPRVATVSDEGWVYAVSEGSCVVTVYSKSNPAVSASINVTVTDPSKVSEIKLSKYEMNLLIGTHDISYVTMLPRTATNIDEVWTSSNPAIASVDNWGNVYALSEGTCTVSVISKANPAVKADIKVTVRSKPFIAPPATTTSTTTSTTTTTTTTTVTAPVPTVTTRLIQNINGATFVDGILIVNKTYGLPADYPTGALNPNALAQFNKLSQDAAKLGLSIKCSSGYRSFYDQERIYNNYVAIDGIVKADTYSARPGHSEHQSGLAIDVNSIDYTFLNTPECDWLAKNAHKYGFIIRYPLGKEAYTGYSYEPWHIRYLGVDTATAVYNSGLSLEEYLGITSAYK